MAPLVLGQHPYINEQGVALVFLLTRVNRSPRISKNLRQDCNHPFKHQSHANVDQQNPCLKMGIQTTLGEEYTPHVNKQG